MTFDEWLSEMHQSAPQIEHQIKRLIDAGFTFDNQIDVERHQELAESVGGSAAIPTSTRLTARHGERTFELEADAKINLVSACAEGEEGELVPIKTSPKWETVIDAVLEYVSDHLDE